MREIQVGDLVEWLDDGTPAYKMYVGKRFRVTRVNGWVYLDVSRDKGNDAWWMASIPL